MKAWRFYGFNDMRLDDVPEPVCAPGHVLVEPLCVQPSVTEAQLALGVGQDEGADETPPEHEGLELQGGVEDPEEAEHHLQDALAPDGEREPRRRGWRSRSAAR